MKTILEELNSVVGIKGSMVIAPDGMLIASLFSGIDDETAAALASRIILSTRQSLDKLGFGDISQLVLTSTHGKIVLVSAGNAFLMVMADMNTSLEHTLIEILSAARKIRNMGRMSPKVGAQ
ncbi:MAG: roadblock/LC7 domain-containing protein [Planctomycetota bacterium]